MQAACQCPTEENSDYCAMTRPLGEYETRLRTTNAVAIGISVKPQD